MVRSDAEILQRRIGREDQEKLDQYFTSVRELERKLTQSEDWLDKPKPQVSYKLPEGADGLDFVDRVPLYYDLMALALQTDSTRIATLEIGGDFEARYFDIRKGYHGLSHHGKDEKTIADLLVLEEYQMKHFARFLTKLKSIPEGDGTLLDHTMVLFGSGMANANAHTNKNLPIILAGGGFKHGEYKALPRSGVNRAPLCNLYVSLLQRFGMEVDSFGISTGALL